MTALAARRARLERERTAGQLRRRSALEQEVAQQLEPLLGPAGRPVGQAAMAIWRRRQVDAYLALGPLARARRSWIAWARPRRGLAVLALGPLWALVCLPLEMLGLVGAGVSPVGVAAAVGAAPLAALLPPRPRGRFTDPLPGGGAPWRGSRASIRVARAALATGAAALAALAAAAVVGPGFTAPPAPRVTHASLHADGVVARHMLAALCGAGVAAAVDPLDRDRYAVAITGGGEGVIAFDRSVGYDQTGARAAFAGPAPECPPS